MIQIPLEIGDIILAGRFKNKKIVVKEIGYDDFGNPTVNGRSILKIRIPKLYKNENIQESKMTAKQMKQRMLDGIKADNTAFELRGAYGNCELWANGDRLEAGSVKDCYNTWIKYRFNPKYEKKTNENKRLVKEEVKPFQKDPIQVKIKKNDGKYCLYRQTINGDVLSGKDSYDTEEEAEYIAMLRGFQVVDSNDKPKEQPTMNSTKLATPPKVTKGDPVKHDKPKEMDLGKEKIIKLEQLIRKVINEVRSKKKYLGEAISWGEFGNDRVMYELVNLIHDWKYKGAGIAELLPAVKQIDSSYTMPALIQKIKTIPTSENIIQVDQRWYYKPFAPKNESHSKKKVQLKEEPNKLDSKIAANKEKLLELQKLQKQLIQAKAQVEAILKATGLKQLEKQVDKLLKEELWDLLEELKKDQRRLVDLGDIIMTVDKFQSEYASYEYEPTLDFALTQVNQDVKEKILLQLKSTETMNKRKGSISFTSKTEAIGSSFWNSITSFLSKILPVLKRKGQKIDAELNKLKQMVKK